MKLGIKFLSIFVRSRCHDKGNHRQHKRNLFNSVNKLTLDKYQYTFTIKIIVSECHRFQVVGNIQL